jgi:excinuclease ABC subunit C
VFRRGVKEPVALRPNTAELFLLARLRDEAHRFANTFHRERRSKAALRSVLDDIPGVGERRRSALLRHFGSVAAIAKATEAELTRAPGMTKAVAATIRSHLAAAAARADDAAEGGRSLDDAADLDAGLADDSAGALGDDGALD